MSSPLSAVSSVKPSEISTPLRSYSTLDKSFLTRIQGFLTEKEASVLPSVCRGWKTQLHGSKPQLQEPLPKFVNLSDPAVLKTYLDEGSRTKRGGQSAMEIVGRVYEARHRAVAETTKYGLVFPMNPEVMAHVMKQVKGKTVLEVGGASGEHSILMAFAGAKQVFVNDLESEEMEMFEKLRRKIPSQIGQKLVSMPGDCLKLVEKNPELAKKMDVILGRNLLHFFNKQQQEEFFKLIKQLLAPGGQAIFVVNSVYSHRDREAFEKNSNSVCFSTINVSLNEGQKPISTLYVSVSPCKEPVDTDELLTFKAFHLYTRRKVGQKGDKWEVDNNAFQAIDAVHRPKIQEGVKKVKEVMRNIYAGSIRVVLNTAKLYCKDTLKELFESQGFTVQSTFVEGGDGHVLSDSQDLFEEGRLVGIIVTL